MVFHFYNSELDLKWRVSRQSWQVGGLQVCISSFFGVAS